MKQLISADQMRRIAIGIQHNLPPEASFALFVFPKATTGQGNFITNDSRSTAITGTRHLIGLLEADSERRKKLLTR